MLYPQSLATPYGATPYTVNTLNTLYAAIVPQNPTLTQIVSPGAETSHNELGWPHRPTGIRPSDALAFAASGAAVCAATRRATAFWSSVLFGQAYGTAAAGSVLYQTGSAASFVLAAAVRAIGIAGAVGGEPVRSHQRRSGDSGAAVRSRSAVHSRPAIHTKSVWTERRAGHDVALTGAG